MAASTPTIAITIISSMRVKPLEQDWDRGKAEPLALKQQTMSIYFKEIK